MIIKFTNSINLVQNEYFKNVQGYKYKFSAYSFVIKEHSFDLLSCEYVLEDIINEFKGKKSF